MARSVLPTNRVQRALIISGLDKVVEAWLLNAMPLWLIEFTPRF